MRTPQGSRARAAASGWIFCARLGSHVRLETPANAKVVVRFDGYSMELGTFSADVVRRARRLRTGLPLGPLTGGQSLDQKMLAVVERLARHGLLEYPVGPPGDDEQVVIEPQVPDYWPRIKPLVRSDILVLSRFAYIRRRGNDLVLESARSNVAFKICNPKIATILARLSTPQQIDRLCREEDFPRIDLLALLFEADILFKVRSSNKAGLRRAEGDNSLILWDFHDLLFHTRSTEGRHANPVGGFYPYANAISPLPAVRSSWPGAKINLRKLRPAYSAAVSPFAKLLRDRHSTRSFDDRQPITASELSRFLDGSARVLSTSKSRLNLGDHDPLVAYTTRPYPSAGAAYELELYIAINKCEGLEQGFYHYNAADHALVRIGLRTQQLQALLAGAKFAMMAPATPQILITIAARFGRVSWKYSSIAYALILKDVGVLTQTFYLVATDMGLGGCAIGTASIDLFQKMTGIEFYVEGPVGQFALGRARKQGLPD